MTEKTTLTLNDTSLFAEGSYIDLPIRTNGFWETLWCFLIRKPTPKEKEELIIVSIDSTTTLTVKPR